MIYQLIKLLDDDGTLFVEREKQIKTYGIDQLKTTSDVLVNAPNAHDYLVFDRIEWKWDRSDIASLVMLKTFAPLSGKLKLDGVDVNPLLFTRSSAISTLLQGQELDFFKLGTQHLILADSLSKKDQMLPTLR